MYVSHDVWLSTFIRNLGYSLFIHMYPDVNEHVYDNYYITRKFLAETYPCSGTLETGPNLLT